MSFHLSNLFKRFWVAKSHWKSQPGPEFRAVTYKNHRCRGLFLGSGLDILDLERSGTSNWMSSLHFYLPLGPLFHGCMELQHRKRSGRRKSKKHNDLEVIFVIPPVSGAVKWSMTKHPSSSLILWPCTLDLFGCENCGGMRRVYPDIVSKCI